MSELKHIESQRILIDRALLPNMRGKVNSTADLQQAMRQHNRLAQFPIKVIPHPEIEGSYLLWDGERRYRSAVAIGIDTLPCLVSDFSPVDALEAQLAADYREAQPEIVLDGEGNVVAGVCWAVHQLTDGRAGGEKFTNVEIAHLRGLTPDNVSAYRALFSESELMKRRFEKGDIAITVYSRLKHQPDELKAEILEAKRGKISRRFVDDYLKRRSVIRQSLKAKKANEREDAPEAERVPIEALLGEMKPNSGEYGRVLRTFLADLRKMLRAEEHLCGDDWALLEQVHALIGDALWM